MSKAGIKPTTSRIADKRINRSAVVRKVSGSIYKDNIWQSMIRRAKKWRSSMKDETQIEENYK